jgi:hypothetical protein
MVLGKREQVESVIRGGRFDTRYSIFGGTGAAGGGREQAQKRKREHGFAGAGFADEAERGAGVESEGNVSDRADPAGGSGKVDGEVADVEERHE